MTEIVALLQSNAPVISTTVLRQMSHMLYDMLISNGRITMLEISRWTEAGGSYLTIQRLYLTPLLCLQIQWIFFISQFHNPNREYIAAGNELAQHSSKIASFGTLRMIRDAFQISGKIDFDTEGNIVAITLNQIHKLAQAFHDYWQAHFAQSQVSFILGEI